VAKLLLLGEQPFDIKRLLEFAEEVPFFVSEVPALAYSRLPKGPEIVMVAGNFVLEPVNLTPKADTPRIFITPRDYRSPDGRRLRDVFGSSILTFDEFDAKVAE
jgi:ATP-dependent DNA helicase RecQ